MSKLDSFKSYIRKVRKKMIESKLSFDGFKPTLNQTNGKNHLDKLSDADLMDLNKLLDWNCFITDAKGRRFGSVAWGAKRVEPQEIPDKRIVLMNSRFNLRDKHVLEVGCFEGVHTLGLLNYTNKVTAVDSRIDHVVKTIVRCGMLAKAATVFKCNLEDSDLDYSLLKADLIHHVGVLYHLKDPVMHLLNLGSYIKQGVMLDTHYCLPEEVTDSYVINGKKYPYKKYLEYGTKEAFSGMYDHSKWLLLDDIKNCLINAGFTKVDIIEERNERNGPRVLLFAGKLDPNA